MLAIQRWQTMTVEAIFQTNAAIDTELYASLKSQIVRALDCVFQSDTVDFKSFYQTIIGEQRICFTAIVQKARRLSYMIQHLETSKLVVTLAPGGHVDMLGTQGLGLMSIAGKTRVNVLEYQTRSLQSVV